MSKREEHTSERSRRVWKILLSVFLVVAAACVTVICVQRYRQGQTSALMESLAEDTNKTPKMETPPMTSVREESGAAAADTDQENGADEDDALQVLIDQGVPIPEKEVDFADLQENVNKDIYAWIYIPDTQIDYPVLQHPTDNYYYLNYNLDGSKGYPGCIYTEDYNKKDFSDPNTVVYGHNMKNGTMFAGLHRFEDSEYFEEHPYVYLYTEEGLYVYEIFAAHESGNEHILYSYDFTDEDVFQEYLSEIIYSRTMNGNIREDVPVTVEDRIITLSTCVAGQADRRYLVQGVLLNED